MVDVLKLRQITLSRTRIAAGAAVVLAILSAYLFRPESEATGWAFAAWFLGGAVFFVAVRGAPFNPARMPCRASLQPEWLSVQPPAAMTRAHKIAVGLGATGMALLAQTNINNVWMTTHVQFALLCASVVLIVWGLGVGGWVIRVSPLPFVRRHWALLAITALALALRVWWLDGAVHYFIDEIHFAKDVAHLTDHVGLLTRSIGHSAYPWIFPYMQGQMVALFGRNLGALRVVSAIAGTLTIPALYLLAQALLDRPTALLAALLLATFPPHVHFSRVGLNNILDPLFGTLALAFLARGLKSGRRRDYAIAGVALGFTQYFHEAGRLLFPPLVLAWIAWVALAQRRSPQPRTLGRTQLVVFGLATFLIAAPIYTTIFALHAPLFPRLNQEALQGDYWLSLLASRSGQGVFDNYAAQISESLFVLFHIPEKSLFYRGETPLMLVYIVPAFFLGVYDVLRRARSRLILPLMWVAATVVGNSVLQFTPQSPRYVVVFPALMLLAAVGIRYTLPMILPVDPLKGDVGEGLRPSPTQIRFVYRSAAMLFVLALAAAQAAYYFTVHLPVYNDQIRMYQDGQDVLMRSLNFPPGTQVNLIGLSQLYAVDIPDLLHFFARDDLKFKLWFPGDFTPTVIRSFPHDVDQAFFVKAEDLRSIRLISDYFAFDPPVFSPYNVPLDKQFGLLFAPLRTMNGLE